MHPPCAPAATATLLVLLATACATPPASPRMAAATRAWLAQFEAAMRFVPPGMHSHWFGIKDWPAMDTEPAQCWLEVYAGRDFEPAWSADGVGDYVGVSVSDYGVGGIRPNDFEREAEAVRTPIGGIPVWCSVRERAGKNGERRLKERWTAFVDDRFEVWATSEALLRAALARDNVPRFGSLEPIPAIPADTRELVLRDLAGTPALAEPALTYLPGVSAILVYAATPPRFQVWGRDEADLRPLLNLLFRAELEGRPLPPPQDRVALEFPILEKPEGVHQIMLLTTMVFFGLSLY
jgi:hypothetical protein